MRTQFRNKKYLSLIAIIIGAILLASCQSDNNEDSALYPLFFEELAGYVNQKGDVIIEPAFALAKEFSEGMAAVIVDERQGTWGFINTDGEIVIEPAYEIAQNFHEGFAPVYNGDSWGFIDKEGNVIIDHQFAGANQFSDGLAAVSMPDEESPAIELWGYIDSNGKFVIEPQFYLAENFVDGSAPVVTLDSAGFIDKEGKFINELPGGMAATGPISEGLAVAADQQKEIIELTCGYGFIDQAGEWQIEAQFCSAGPFTEGLAAVAVYSEELGMVLWGYVDKNGEMAIDANYLLALDFYNGLARVITTEGKSGYVDKNGEWVLLDTQVR